MIVTIIFFLTRLALKSTKIVFFHECSITGYTFARHFIGHKYIVAELNHR